DTSISALFPYTTLFRSQETRRYDEATGTTILMRVKEGSEDYRYFPEPDLVELYIDEEWKARVRESIPELPDARKKRYVEELGLRSEEHTSELQSRENLV